MDELRNAARAASDAHEADIFMYSGPIDDDGFAKLAASVTACAGNGRNRAILMLVTSGGLANAGYRMARLLQNMYPEFWLYCPRYCKSAGTLVAIGAHRLIMDSFSELGPLDVQLLKEDELGARKSGLLAKSTFEALSEEAFKLYERLMLSIKMRSQSLVSFKLASSLAADMSSKLLAQVYAQISPDTVGNEQRDLDIAVQYGVRLDSFSDNASSGHTVYHLVRCYPSHDFIIDDEEARELFDNVDVPSVELYRLLGELVGEFGGIVLNEAEEPIVVPLTAKAFLEDDDDDSEDSAVDSDAGGALEVDDSGGADQRGDSTARDAPVPSEPQNDTGEGVQEAAGKVRPIRGDRS
jgi:hypothetical protein